MRFSAVSAIFGLVASVVAQDPNFDPIYTPTSMEQVPVGQPYTITWTAQPADVVDAPVSIILIGGPTQNSQVPLYTIATGVTNSAGSYVWTPDTAEFGKNFYGLIIRNDNSEAQFQYSNPFQLVSDGTTPDPTDTTTDTTTTTSVPPVTQTVSLSSVVQTSSSVVVTPTTTSLISIEAVPTTTTTVHHNNTTTTRATSPVTTLTPIATTLSTTTAASTPTPPTVPGSGAVANGISLALIGAGALFALAF